MLDSPPAPVDRSAAARDLLCTGYLHLGVPHERKELAWSCAEAVFREAAQEDAIGVGMPPLGVVGEFTVPPPSVRRRDFQALHLDFGLPVVPRRAIDVARFTALYVDPARAQPTASTRIVPLRRLLGQRAWAQHELLVERLRSHRTANAGHVEGILARLIEAADGSATLPRSDEPGFLCGLEFDSRVQERDHFAQRGLDLEAVERRVRLGPGELLLLDNLATAHGRVGVRQPRELHQLCVGFPSLNPSEQRVLLWRVVEAVFP